MTSIDLIRTCQCLQNAHDGYRPGSMTTINIEQLRALQNFQNAHDAYQKFLNDFNKKLLSTDATPAEWVKKMEGLYREAAIAFRLCEGMGLNPKAVLENQGDI
jgi:hypothetical protein